MSATGLITIAFSRPVFYEIKRTLADVEYTTEEMQKISEGIIANLITENDWEGSQETPSIASVRVTEAREAEIDILVDYINPESVSKDPVIPDYVSIKFDAKVFKDEETIFEIGNGEPLLIKVPR